MQILSYFHPDSFDIRSCEQQIYCSVLRMKTDEMKFHNYLCPEGILAGAAAGKTAEIII